jgi:hypothetical protein
VAQSKVENLPLMTKDATLANMGLRSGSGFTPYARLWRRGRTATPPIGRMHQPRPDYTKRSSLL